MDLDAKTGGLVGSVVGALVLIWRLGWRAAKLYLELVVLAALERDRIRERKRRRSTSEARPAIRASSVRDAIPEWADPDDEITDMHVLIERERTRRKTRPPPLRSRTERPPRPGTHHDGED